MQSNSAIKFYKVFRLMSYDDAIAHSHTINLQTIGEKIYCRIPDEQFSNLEFISCGEIAHDVMPPEKWEMNVDFPWINIDTSALNQSIGPHMYQFKFRNKRFDEIMYLYFYYVIQNDKPEQPYIYMERDN